MKRLLSGLFVFALINTGCITFPKGVHPWARPQPSSEESTEATPRAAPKAAPNSSPSPKQVNLDEISLNNPRTTLRQLEAEIRHDERTR